MRMSRYQAEAIARELSTI
ncbi:hypothetical protein TALC_00720 [Thermoplasmatales archaeon BRNA1]|nr:hypothetical protein TALC_00720 [Thermoplasmatales archaeon BRNA1]